MEVFQGTSNWFIRCLAFLPLKFHNFAAGIAMAPSFLKREDSKSVLIILVMVTGFLIAGNRSPYIPALFFYLAGGGFVMVTQLKAKHLAHYDLYLIISPQEHCQSFIFTLYFSSFTYATFFAYFLNGDRLFISWALLSTLLLIITMTIAYLIYRCIELPGIQLGKLWSKDQTAKTNHEKKVF